MEIVVKGQFQVKACSYIADMYQYDCEVTVFHVHSVSDKSKLKLQVLVGSSWHMWHGQFGLLYKPTLRSTLLDPVGFLLTSSTQICFKKYN